MPYVPQDEDKEKEQTAEGGQPPAEIGQGAAGAAPTKSGFVNVDEYLSKNPNEGQALTDRVVSNLESQKSDTQNAISGAGSQFGQQVESGTVKGDNDFLGRAFSSPESFVGNNDDVARFMAMRDAAYSGPQSLQQTDLFAPAQSKVDALKRTGESVGTEAGRNALLNPLSPKPTAGKTALNQLILQGTPDAAQRLSATAKTFPAVEQQWQDVISQGNQRAQQGQQETEATRGATRSGLTSTTDAFKAALQSKLGKATSERDAFNTKYMNLSNALNSGQSGADLTQQQLGDLGIPDAYPYLSKLNDFNLNLSRYGAPVSLSSYVTQPGQAVTNMPTLGNVAGSEDYAREAALQQLSGQDLGLSGTQENPFVMNGRLPGVDYMGAFNKAGGDLKSAEEDFLKNIGYTFPQTGAGGAAEDWYSKYYPMVEHMKNPDYYTSPEAGATPLTGYQLTPPPQGWDVNQPAPYPEPTSNPPPGIQSPKWNPYTGQWEGPMLMPTNPPPGGGGHAIY